MENKKVKNGRSKKGSNPIKYAITPEEFKVLVRAKVPVRLIAEDKVCEQGEMFYVKSEKRLKELLGKNEYKVAFVEIVSDEEKDKVLGELQWTEKK